MIIPEGLTLNVGRREYHAGEELPGSAPESAKKLVSDRIAALGKDPETAKAEAAKKRQGLVKKAVEEKLVTPEEAAKLSDKELEKLLSGGGK